MFELSNDWKNKLQSEFTKEYFVKLQEFLTSSYQEKKIYPPIDNVFQALNLTNFNDVKVVILGQDPYHQKGQAHGLSFSVSYGVKTPPSLDNIYKELKSDLGCYIPDNGNLTKWASQGVLLLNTVLTVEDSKPNSHKSLGWEQFTGEIIKCLNKREKPVVFLLWGANAKALEPLIDKSKHFVLSAAHPSPFSAYSGFFGCRHFSKTNAILKLIGEKPIDWQIENQKLSLDNFITNI